MTAEESASPEDRTPWVKIRVSLPKHRKVFKLKQILELHSRQEALGVILDLFTSTFIHCWADGDWGKGGAERLEDILDWRGESGALYNALHDCGFMEDGRVRDWHKHQGRLIGARVKYYEKTGRQLPVQDPNETRMRAKASIAARNGGK